MHTVYLLLGSNEGNRLQYLLQAIVAIEERIGMPIRSSSVYESEPWGFDSNQSFLNQVVMVRSMLSANEVLEQIALIEHLAGRQRTYDGTYTSRTLDIDILFYDDLVLDTNILTIPHPRLHLRRFTLAPLVEIAPELIHPLLQLSMEELYWQCPDKGKAARVIVNG